MSDDGKKRAQRNASRLAEFRDCDQEFRETKNQDAIRRRHKAMRKGTTNDFTRAGVRLAENASAEGRDTQERLKRMKYTGWKRKE